LNALNSRVYAVRANYNRLLDVARETYKENVGDIFALNRGLSDRHQLPFQLIYQEGARGFVLALKKSDLEDVGGLPFGFINVTGQKGRLTFSTLELVHSSILRLGREAEERVLSSQQKRNARMRDALDETLLLSDQP
jgi:DNA mismatch repair protein MSH4